MAVKLGYQNVYRDPSGYPEWQAKGLPVAVAPAGFAGTAQEPAPTVPLSGWPLLWTLLGILAAGMALNLTPCVYPLIPITVSYFGGQSGKGKGALAAHGLCYIVGLSMTNSLLGVMAALGGGLLGAMLQNPVVLVTVAGILVLFASSLFGFWELRLPSGLTQAASKSYTGYLGTWFMGLTLGVVAAPCIGPFVLGLLTWMAGIGSPWLGFIVFFTLSLGLGLPLFVLALFSGQIVRLPHSGEWMVWVRKLMGWALVGMAAYFVRPLLTATGGVLLLTAVAAVAALHLGWIAKAPAGLRGFNWLRTGAGVGGLVLATFLMGSWIAQGAGVTWQPYSDELLEEARKEAKPVIIDFSAQWCTPCRELEDKTFHDAELVRQAKQDFLMLKVDVTRGDDPAHGRWLERYRVKGVPTVVFLDREGNERRDLRLVDFMPPEQFLVLMAELKRK